MEVEKSNNDPFDLPDTAEFIKIKKENGNLIVDAATTHKIIQKLTSPKLHTESLFINLINYKILFFILFNFFYFDLFGFKILLSLFFLF